MFMRNLSRKALAAAAVLIFSWPALADVETAQQAAQMMARAQALDLKCNFLSFHERDKLSKFTARAELALANRESAEATKAAMKRGREAAQAATCSLNEKVNVQQILAAALQAAGEEKQAAKLAVKPAPAGADAQSAKDIVAKAWPTLDEDSKQADVSAVAEEPPQVPQAAPTVPMAPVPSPTAQTVSAEVSAVADSAPAVAPSGAPEAKLKAGKILVASKPAALNNPDSGLATYEKVTEAYYRARRCGGNQGAAYQAVVAEHARVMHNHSASEVSAALHRAEARAGTSSCS
jgi:hypothetical protein